MVNPDRPNDRPPRDGQLLFDWSATPNSQPVAPPPAEPRGPIDSGGQHAERRPAASSESAPPPPGDPTTRVGYHPGHPWYYLRAGDGKAPIPFADIPAAKDAGRFLGRELPKSPAKRIIKARALLEDERQKLEDDRRRYQDIIERGVEALSRYDRGIAYGGQRAELAVASSLALKFNHIAWRKGRIAFLENERSDPRRPGR